MESLEAVIARIESAMFESAKLSPTGVYGECVVTIADLRTLIEAAREKRK